MTATARQPGDPTEAPRPRPRKQEQEPASAEVTEVAPKDGGDLGWLPVDQLADWMREALDPLEPGAVSNLVVQPFGCSVLQLVERREMGARGRKVAEERFSQTLVTERIEEIYRSVLDPHAPEITPLRTG